MSDEQQPHRQEPVSGWQPMPHGPEYDAESTAFVQLPPDYAHPNPADPSGHWDPLAAPGTGYAPPPMDAGHGDPSQGGQWQPAGHDQGAAHDQGMTGHWTTADAAGAYLYGGLHDPHGSGQWAMPAEDQQGHHPQHTGHWPAPAAEEPVDDWPVPTPSDGADGPVHTSQWTIPVAGDDGVDETGEYRVDDHPGPAAPPYGDHPDGPQDPQTTAQLRMPFIAGATPQQQPHEAHQPHQSHQPGQPHEAHQPHPGQQQGHTGQWSVPAAEEGVEDSGEYAVEGHPGPAAPPAAATPPPARRPLGMPDRDEPVPAADPAWPGPSAGDSGQFAVEGHQGLHTPQHGGPVPGERQSAADDPAWGHGGPAAGDSGEFPVDGQHAGLHTPPHGSPAPGLPQDAAWQGEFTGERFEGERFEGERFDGEPFEGEQLDGDRFAGDAHGHAPHPGPEAGAGHTDAPADGRDAAEAPAEPSAEAVPDGAGPEAAEPAGGPEPAAAEGEFTAAADAAEGPAPAEPRPETPAEIPEAADAPAEPVPGPAPAEAAPAGPVASPIDEFPSHSEHPLTSYVLHVNGADRPVTDVWIGESLLYVLRERLGLAGAKDGCSQGECGACSVQVDGRLVASCLVPAATAAGSEVRTVEGLAAGGQPSDVQRALAECGAVQCGFCVPGLAMTVHDLLEGNHAPTDQQTRQAISGNLCRCSGYRGVLDAVREVVASREAAAAEADADGGPDAHQDPARIPHQAGPHGITGNGSVNGSGSGRASA